ncbi:hypothetical protein GGR52DRAFT_18826 [Hypoxylon sp. FL1284]|nr:hypothetical protein GGR52DRAFT_18826 [Hypoxylon sp. FL1284]
MRQKSPSPSPFLVFGFLASCVRCFFFFFFFFPAQWPVEAGENFEQENRIERRTDGFERYPVETSQGTLQRFLGSSARGTKVRYKDNVQFAYLILLAYPCSGLTQ